MEFRGTWNFDHKIIVLLGFSDVKEQLSDRLKDINNGLSKAEALSDCCAYKLYLLEKLKFIYEIVKKADADLRSRKILYLQEDYWESSKSPFADIGWESFFWARNIRFNINPSYSFFDQNTAERQTTIFHELTHIYGTGDDDKWWNNAHVLDDMFQESWRKIAIRARNEAIVTKGENGCLNPAWPDN